MKSSLLTIILLFSFSFLYSQKKEQDNITRKKITITKTTSSPKIDGILDDPEWQNAPIATHFIERNPNNGKPQDDSIKTEVRILYDDTGIYFGAQMYDPTPQKVAKELTERDGINNDDFFGVTLNGYNDKQQSLEFVVTAAGVQFDAKITSDGEDESWNSIWYSGAKINDKGWSAEIKIPYSELRFPDSNVQEWGMNMFRRIQRIKASYDWNFVDNQKNSYTLFDGVLQGIENINPPTRLSFTPYFSTYVNNFDGKTTSSFNGGMDVKYGINDAFTFDMTLIPDFGQANFDNSILNLTPFEQQFSEQRTFFTEGTELFSKGGMFYSRRVGGEPTGYPVTNEKEEVLEYPSKVKLFNAFKISGRTKSGLGIGFFNGVTQKMEATIINYETGEKRKEVVEPWTNYSVLVFDQRFNGNSSVSLVNTNVTRDGNFRDANATGILWDINNKKNTYKTFGSLKGSWVMNGETKFGTRGEAGLEKIAGKNRFSLNGNVTTKDWNINDLGFSTKTNFANYNAWYGYRILQPTEKFNNVYLNFNINYYHRLEPFIFSNLIFNNNNSFTDKKFRVFGGGIEFTPFGQNDIYEPRTFGRHLKVPGYFDSWVWFESDSRKKLQYNFTVDYYAFNEKGRNQVFTNFGLRYRFSDKFNVHWTFNPSFSNNETGFAGKNDTDIFIGRRQRNTYENALTSKYTFNEKMALSLAFRHYFSDVTYKQFYTLNQDGSLTDTALFDKNLNGTYNAWNVDLRFSWWFAPGSQLTLLYRNATSNYLETSRLSVKNNYDVLFNEPMVNNFSLKLTYFLDYNRVKNWTKKKTKS
ncbi:DUF5916 domain-containing protein [Chryseobacterium daecheongense]|uniref:Carbohydrate binding protein with CBM9 domain n=1 Tax=Chryseobacterium daecheongense TaxID=192389 RepID=A0A3N0VXN7_9FLAO|nr:DUF5916 domain-containing protein [Chryseobacterium daecheongense]ROH97583.1 hypothetical protein EGI05_09360 [Chryseobacterium daecheongense]TDX93266.1 carbohydrate binding protein with CBM9 domain [Chryseobacterium daecheongense]